MLGQTLSERAARLSEARTLALLVGSLLFAAIAVSRPSWAAQDGPVLVLAFLALAAALATRSGAIPFHLPAARLGRRGASMSPALVLIWIPAGIGVLAVSWSATTFGVRSDWLDLVATTVQIVAIATLVLGAVGALLHDDVTEIAVYSIVADSGFILLALASRDEGAAEPARLWLLVFIAAKTAFVAWAAAASQAFGSSSLGELRGWLRRTPILGLALVAIAAATLGWPGSAVYEARSTLISLALPDRLHFLSVVAIVLSLAYFGRLLLVGLLSPVDAVTAAAGERPRWRRRRGVAAATADSSTSPAAPAGLAIAADGSADRSAGDQAASAAGPAAVPGPLAPAGAATAASSDTPKPKAKRKASRSVATAEIWPAVTDPATASLATDAAGPAGVPDSATAADTKPESASTSGEGTAAAPTVEPGLGFGSWLVSAWRLNRTLEVSGAVLAASALALVLSLGGLGASSVSRDGIPFDVAARATPTPSPTPRPTPSPRPTVTPIALPTPVPTASPSSSASSTASASPVP